MGNETDIGGWPGNEQIVSFGELDVSVRVAPNGEVSATPQPAEPDTRVTIEREHTDDVVIIVEEDMIIVVGMDIPLYIPRTSDGKIPAVIGHKSIPGWLMKELRLLGFHYDESEIDEAWS